MNLVCFEIKLKLLVQYNMSDYTHNLSPLPHNYVITFFLVYYFQLILFGLSPFFIELSPFVYL